MDLLLMLPRTLSATSLQVAALCMTRWKAEYLNRAEGFSGVAANIGSTCHLALERYVEMVYMKREREASWMLLESLYGVAYIETFGHADTATDEFKDGLNLIKRWHARTDLSSIEVLSVEQKRQMMIPVEYRGEKITIPFSYIIDRLDKVAPGHYRVVDYKSVRVPIQPDALEAKVQARVYALSVQRDYPDAERITVIFDLLRHDPVGIDFTKEDNFKTAHYLMNEAQRIVDTDETNVLPTLNLECGYCVLASTCKAMKSNVTNGGIHSLSEAELVERKMMAEAQSKANRTLIEQIDDVLMRAAVERDELSWQTVDGAYEVEIVASRRRQVDASKVAEVIGPELFKILGSITLGKIDELIKDESLPKEMRDQLKSLVYYKTGDPAAKVKKVKSLV